MEKARHTVTTGLVNWGVPLLRWTSDGHMILTFFHAAVDNLQQARKNRS